MQKRNLDTDKKLLAFTFDDGPGEYMPQIAAVFEQFHGRATFFGVGKNLNPQTAEYALHSIENGHEIGCHGQKHHIGTSCDEVYREIAGGLDNLYTYLPGYTVKYYRSAGLKENTYVWQVLSSPAVNMPLLGCEYSTYDWMKDITAEEIVEKLFHAADTGRIRDGSVILCHEREKTVRVLPEILQKLYADGFRFCTVSEYLEAKQINYKHLTRSGFVKNLKDGCQA